MRRRLRDGTHPITELEKHKVLEWVHNVAVLVNARKDEIEEKYRVEHGLEEWPVEEIIKYRQAHGGEFPKGVVLSYPAYIYEEVEKITIPVDIMRILNPKTRKEKSNGRS